MVKMYKLVSQDYTTHGAMKWEIGKTNKATGKGTKMCTDQVLHCYASPLQAVFLNLIHTNIQNPVLLEIDCSPILATDGLKHASKEQTPIKVMPLPKLTTNQRVAIGIKLALTTYKNPKFITWASNWISGTDRSYAAARAAAYAAGDDADAAAAYAARAAYAAYAAADAAAYAAGDAAARAAYAAYAAADAAAYAAAYDAGDAARGAFCMVIQKIIDWVVCNID